MARALSVDLRRRVMGAIEGGLSVERSALAAKSDVTLAELRDGLKERGVAVAIGTLWRFFNAGSRAKKDGARRRAAPQHGERGARSVDRRTT